VLKIAPKWMKTVSLETLTLWQVKFSGVISEMTWKVCLILATTRWYHPLGRWAFFRLTIGIPCWKPSLCDNPRYVLDGTWTICSVKNKNILNHSGYLADFGIEHQLLEVASALFKALSKGYIFLSLPQFRHGLEHIRTLFSKMFPLKLGVKTPHRTLGLFNFRYSSIHDAGGDRTKGLRGSGWWFQW